MFSGQSLIWLNHLDQLGGSGHGPGDCSGKDQLVVEEHVEPWTSAEAGREHVGHSVNHQGGLELVRVHPTQDARNRSVQLCEDSVSDFNYSANKNQTFLSFILTFSYKINLTKGDPLVFKQN